MLLYTYLKGRQADLCMNILDIAEEVSTISNDHKQNQSVRSKIVKK